MKEIGYQREAVLEYAKRWAKGRNPRYLDFEHMGGDCTNFASQCIYAGSGVMNYTPTMGWYYSSGSNRSPSWTFEYEVVPVGFSAAVTALEAGECDGVIAGMSITDERVQKYDFSEPYYDSGVGMAVLSDSDITSYDQLKDQKVAAKIGTEGCTFAESIAEQYGFEVIQYESSSDMYQAVIAGEAVACFEDYPVIGYEISRGLGLTLPTPMEKGSSYGFATLKGANPELVEMFNKGLENIKASGRYDEILNTYIAK